MMPKFCYTEYIIFDGFVGNKKGIINGPASRSVPDREIGSARSRKGEKLKSLKGKRR